MKRGLPILVAAALAAVLPVNAAVVFERPLQGLGTLLLLFGAWQLLRPAEGGHRPAAIGLLALALSAVLAPEVVFIAAAIPFLSEATRRRRWTWGLSIFALAAVATLLNPELRANVAELASRGDTKAVQAVTIVPKAVLAALLPWQTPVLGLGPNESPTFGILLATSALFALGLLLASGIKTPWRAWGCLVAAATLAPIPATLLGRPHLAAGMLIGWALWPLALLLTCRGALASQDPRRRRILLGGTFGLALLLVVGTLPRTIHHVRTFSDPGRSFAALLEEDPTTPLRWEYALWRKAQGDLEGWKVEADRFLRTHDGEDARAICFALEVSTAGDQALAVARLKKMKKVRLPGDPTDRRHLLTLLEKGGAFDLYFPLAEEAALADEGLHLEIAEAAARADRAELLEKHLKAALAKDRPPLRALEMSFRRLAKGQDIAGLKALGARARALYPDKALGYLALGRAAKLVRADEEMIGFYREALLRNPDLAEVHYDMGLVLHARSEDAEEAAAHYQKVLELVPAHPRRQVIEGWIASLKGPETSGGGQ